MSSFPRKLGSPQETPTPETPSEPEPSRRPRRLRWLIGAVVLVALAGAGYFAYRQFFPAQTAAPTVQTFAVRRGNILSSVAATGTIANQNVSRLSFPSSGSSGSASVVTAIDVSVGDTVKKGQALATLDSSSLQLAVTQAQASLASAQSKLALIQAGPLPSDVANGQAAVANAQTNLDTVKAGATDADISSAQQAVASADSQVQNARSALAKLKAGPTAQDVHNAQIAINQANISLSNARLQQNTACTYTAASTNQQGTPIPTATPGPSFFNGCQAAKNSVTSATYQLTIARNNLAKLQTPASAADVAASEASVHAAENNYNAAVAKLNTLKSGPTQTALDAAQAQLASAQASLYKVQHPYTDADVQTAQAAVAQAQASLATAQASLATATLAAPFDGIISAVAINVGEAPASPAMTIVDPVNLVLNTSVDESSISKVQVGQPVSVTFDAVPNETFQGTVKSIAPTATIQSGVSLYAVQVTINPNPIAFPGGGASASRGANSTPGANATPGAFRRSSATPAAGATPAASAASTPLKAGMTGNATIVYGDAQNVLVVPNNAVKAQGRNHVVQLLVNGKPESRQVTIGASNDQYTEITEGLAEGDQVVVTGTTATSGRVGGTGIPGGGVFVRQGGFGPGD